jgi:hypothetical protein
MTKKINEWSMDDTFVYCKVKDPLYICMVKLQMTCIEIFYSIHLHSYLVLIDIKTTVAMKGLCFYSHMNLVP